MIALFLTVFAATFLALLILFGGIGFFLVRDLDPAKREKR